MKTKKSFFILLRKLSLGLLPLALAIAAIVGEVKCIYKAIDCDWDPIGKAEVIYTVSAASGVGVVVGYINIEDK